MGDALIEKLKHACPLPSAILDIGAGTARDARRFCEKYPTAQVVACDIAHGMMEYARQKSDGTRKCVKCVTADMEQLPFRAEAFDAIFSNAALQWTEDMNKVFACVRSILRPAGAFCFTTFGGKTLIELKKSFDETYNFFGMAPKQHVNEFTPVNDIIIALRRAGFVEINVEIVLKRIKHKDARELLKSLKAIGSHNASRSRYMGKEFMRKALEVYESKYHYLDGIFATYEVYYFVCKR